MTKKQYQYFFVLGTNHTLSKVEIVNVLTRKGISFQIIEASEEILLIKTKAVIDAVSLMMEMGGVVKIGEIFSCYPSDFEKKFLAQITSLEFEEFFKLSETLGFNFGVSVYNGGGGFKKLNQTWFLTPIIVRQIKEKLNLNYLPLKERILPSFLIDKKDLLKHGFEIIVVTGFQGIYIGKTLAIQDYQSYSRRDYGRPSRNPKSGMMPPKLAKIMINLAGKDKKQLFLDPFCGTGTILQELILLGYQNLVGSDLDERAISSSENNLNWLFKEYQINKADFNLKLFKSDVKNLAVKIPKPVIEAIVTEPYLGSPKAKYFSQNQIKKEAQNLSLFYLDAFGEFEKIVKKDGVVVITFPVFRFKNNFYYLEILNQIHQLGFINQDLILGKPAGFEFLKLNLTDRQSVIFFHPGQTISREIFIFTKTSQ